MRNDSAAGKPAPGQVQPAPAPTPSAQPEPNAAGGGPGPCTQDQTLPPGITITPNIANTGCLLQLEQGEGVLPGPRLHI